MVRARFAVVLAFSALSALACGAPAAEDIGSSSAAVTTVCGVSSSSAVQGVDVSVYQGAFDWSAQKAAGVVWGYARIGDGLGGDSEFAPNWTNMKAAGILRGAYQFFEPGDDEVAQANLMIQAVGTLGEGDLPCMIDVEVTGGQSGATIATKVAHWIQLVQAGTGKPPIIYTGPYFWEDSVGSKSFGSTPLWVADYGPSCPLIPNGWSAWTMWQYSDGGGSLDHDVFNGSLADLQKLAAAPGPVYPTVVHRGAVDIDGDGISDVCGRSPTGIVCEISNHGAATTELQGPAWSDASGWNKPEYYWTIQFADINGDGKGDLCARDSMGVVCELSTGSDFTGGEVRGPNWSDAGNWNNIQYYSTIQFGDIDGDGKADVCGRAAAGIQCALSTGTGFSTTVINGPAWSDAGSWNQPQYYATIQLVDVNGDGLADVCGRSATGIVCEISNGTGFPTEVKGPGWSDATGWAAPEYESTIRYADIDGDGLADVCGRGQSGIVCEISNGTGFPTEVQGPKWDDASGWNNAAYYTSIQTADINGDGKQDICGRNSSGVLCELSNGTGFPTEVTGPAWTSSGGWDDPQYTSTMGFGDVDGDGKDDVCARGWAGMQCALSKGTTFAAAVPSTAMTQWSDPNGWGVEPYYATIRYAGIKTLTITPKKPPSTTADGGTQTPPVKDNATTSSGGCSVGSGSGASGWALLLVGVMAAGRRRGYPRVQRGITRHSRCA
jgi:MYXO-CTERM domain-containing protein